MSPRLLPFDPPHPPEGRVFLLLQGPHGPFFARLGALLRDAGATVWRVGFNGGDRAFWRDRDSYIPFRGRLEDWPDTLDTLMRERGVTDIVLYGDTRPVHAAAVAEARRQGVTIHVFEEGYLRPWWVTYERGGANGHSRLMDLPLSAMQAALCHGTNTPPPDHWGETRHHVFYGALYHGCVLAGARDYPRYRPHRAIGLGAEFRLHLRRLALVPALAVERRRSTRRMLASGHPYHVALLQLDHDAALRTHAPFPSTRAFLEVVITGFARGAPPHHHLIFKAHPLEDGRVPLRRHIRALARAAGVADRVHYIPGGKLAPLLDGARSAVTVNSTAGQQALWRGIPLKAFGRGAYTRPEFTSGQPLPAFFADPRPPDLAAYRAYRQFLLETSQVAGGYYSARGRQQILRHVSDLMLAPADPYEARLQRTEAEPQQKRRMQ